MLAGRGGGRNGAAGGRAAGEGHHAHVGVAHQGIAGDGAAPVDQVHHARRHAGLGEDFHEARHRQRRGLGGLEHAAVAKRQGRGDLGGGQGQRGVPRRDQGRHASGLAQHVAQVLVVLNAGLLHVLRLPVGKEGEVAHDARQLARAQVAQGQAAVERLQLGEFVQVGFGELGDLAEDGLLLGGRLAGPHALLVGAAGGLHGAVGLGRVGLRQAGHHLLGGGVDHVQQVRARGLPLTVDVAGDALARKRRGLRAHAMKLPPLMWMVCPVM
jgi:hypothetical protein